MRGFDDGSEMLDDMRHFGATEEQIAKAAEQFAGDFEIDPDNWSAFVFFYTRCCSTAWNRHGMTGAPIGLNYPSVESLARILGIELDAEYLDKLQTLEKSYVEEAAKQMNRKHG